MIILIIVITLTALESSLGAQETATTQAIADTTLIQVDSTKSGMFSSTDTSRIIETFAAIVFGWVLGQMGLFIHYFLNRRRRKNTIRTGILSELHQIRLELIMYQWRLSLRYEGVNLDRLKWMQPRINEYVDQPEQGGLAEIIKVLLNVSNDDLPKLSTQAIESEKRTSPMLRVLDTPYLRANTGETTILDERIRAKLFEIQSKLASINQEIDMARSFFEMTFDPEVMRQNATTIRNNLESGFQSISAKSRRLVDQIEDLGDKWNPV